MPQINEMPSDKNNQPSKRYETDSQKIIHRHLENEKDIITDEDIRNIKIDTHVDARDLLDTDVEVKENEEPGQSDENTVDAVWNVTK